MTANPILHRSAGSTEAPCRASVGTSDRTRQRGQVLVIFAGAIILFMGLLAVVLDVSWYWANSLRVQRAADAAALAGAVYLPGDVPAAQAAARAEARKNGYTDGTNATVTPFQDPVNDRQLVVDVSAPVNTFFMRVFGLTTIEATRRARAEYVLPVPMGSPQNYFGVGFLRDAIETPGDSGWRVATAAPSGGEWQRSPTSGTTIQSVVASLDTAFAFETTNGHRQRWENFGLATTAGGSPIPTPGTGQALVIRGIEVRLSNTRLSAACTTPPGSTNRISVELSWNNGSSWSTTLNTPNLNTDATADYTLGDSGSTSLWGTRTWLRDNFTNANFEVRLTALKGCSTAAVQLQVDRLEVRVHYALVEIEDVDMVSPYGEILPPHNFWGAMQSQGAPNIQGDAYMTRYQSRSGLPANSDYNWQQYYSYAVTMPPGSTGGEVWIFDPGFCDATTTRGTGEAWTVGGANGFSSRQPVSSFFDLYDTLETPYNLSDDVLVASSGDAFRRVSFQDHDIFMVAGATTNVADCSNLAWHFDANDWRSATPSTPRRGWHLLASGLTGGPTGRTYRLHTYSTDRNNLDDQNNTTALNAFAIYARASGGTPRVYGLGAMQAFVRLPGGQASEFYLAQIDAVHAGKTMMIRLWDPGDTGALAASLEILMPGATTYSPTRFSWRSWRNTSDANASNCNGLSGTNVMSVVTNTGGSSRFNGCWLEMEVVLPADYTAPNPSTDPITREGGWWKIRYSMGGSAANFSTDMTTWEVQIRGNPVHLKLP
jgi:hypothetical protein